jgi:hypothetical protein
MLRPASARGSRRFFFTSAADLLVIEVVDLKPAAAVLVPQSSLHKRVSDGGQLAT